MKFSDDASGFVSIGNMIPDALLDIRYYSAFNFIGERIDGYEEPAALLTREAAEALKAACGEAVSRGYCFRIFDAYRPQRAVDHFVRWAKDPADIRMKPYFYPDLEKQDIIPRGYIAEHSGHSRGSTVDLTLFDMASQRDIDTGGTFDFFGERSHPDYAGISGVQRANRMLLRELMVKHGFRPLDTEWWHFTLENEPRPDTYFTFPVRNSVLHV
jgi:D-alanyl-D-alanine dipeptidase